MKWLPESSIRGGLRKIRNEKKKISKFYDLQLHGFCRAMQKRSEVKGNISKLGDLESKGKCYNYDVIIMSGHQA